MNIEIFFQQDVLDIAKQLLGKTIVRQFEDGTIKQYKITETEAYKNEEDLACHCSKGRTKRTEIMYASGGVVYVYLIYGMYWMLNFVCGEKDVPQAVLIRAAGDFNGPGKLGKELKLDKSFYGENLASSKRICLDLSSTEKVNFIATLRIGVDYAGEIWKNKKWRFVVEE